MASQIYVNGVTLSDAAEWNKWDTATYVALSSAAGTNTITATGPANLTSVATNPPLWFIPAAINTGAVTLNITPSGGAALGAKAVFSGGLACSGGELAVGVPAIVVYDGTQFHIVSNSPPKPFQMGIAGCTYANNSGDATNDIDFAAGQCRDSTNVVNITCAAKTKRLDANWAVGTNQGMRNSAAAITDTGYYLWAVATAVGVQDYYAHTSATAATVLTALQAETGGAAYAYLRLIGWITRVGGTIVAMTTYEIEGGGIEMNWVVPTLDINLAATLTTSRRTDAVKVPLNFSTEAHLNVVIEDASAGRAWVCCPDQTDAAPSGTAAPLANVAHPAGVAVSEQLWVRTSSAGLIAARDTVATVDLYAVSTMGFRWARRN